MKQKKIVIFGLIIVFMMGIIFIIFNKKTNNSNPSSETVQLKIPSPTPTYLPEIYSLNKQIGSLNWQIVNLPIPSATNYMQVRNQDVSITGEALIKLLGFNQSKIKVDNDDVLWVESNNGYFYITKKDFRIQYQSNNNVTTVKSQATRTAIKDRVITRFITFCNTLTKGKVEVVFNKIDYTKSEGVRAVPAAIDNADFIDVYADLTINGIKILTSAGAPYFRGTYDFNQNLLIFNTQNVWADYSIEKPVILARFANLQNLDRSSFKVFSVEGNADFAQSNFEDPLTSVTITSGEFVYIYSNNIQKLEPYLILKGNAIVSTGPIIVTVGTSAIKQ